MILLPVILTLPYLFILLWIYIRLTGNKQYEAGENTNVFVSIVVACRNEEESLPSLLESLYSQEYPQRLFEVIIVDDNSTDKTSEVARSFEGKMNITVTQSNGSGKKHALKTGITRAHGELILTTDADCTPGKRWISGFVSVFDAQKPDLMAGPVRLTAGSGFFGKFQEIEFLSLQAVTAGTMIAGNATMCNGANLAFTRSAWLNSEKDLRFDIATGDDVFLLHSLKKQRAKIRWVEQQDALVETEAAPGLAAFLRQRKRWASKSTAYRDNFSICLGIVTFVTNLVLSFTLIASIFSIRSLLAFTAVFFIKSIPDFLLLFYTTSRYNRRNLMWWFLPSQLVYPFYVLIVAVFALLYPPTPLKGG